MDPHLCIGIDVGCKAHRVGIATPDGSILEESGISHTDAGFQEFFRRIEDIELNRSERLAPRPTLATIFSGAHDKASRNGCIHRAGILG